MSTTTDRNESLKPLVLEQTKQSPYPSVNVTTEKICIASEAPTKKVRVVMIEAIEGISEIKSSGDETESTSESSDSRESSSSPESGKNAPLETQINELPVESEACCPSPDDTTETYETTTEQIDDITPLTSPDDTTERYETTTEQIDDITPISSEMPPSTFPDKINFPTGKITDQTEATAAHRPLGRSKTVPANLGRTATLKSCLKNSSSKTIGTLDHQSRRQSSNVAFDKIVIREYKVTVGDNPSVSSGAPVTLDWHVQEEHELLVESYESCRGHRRHKDELKLPCMYRELMLREEWEVPQSEIREAKNKAQRGKVRRIHATKFIFADGAKMAVEETGKKLKRAFRKPSKEEKELKAWLRQLPQ